MSKEQKGGNVLRQKAIKVMASVARGIAKDSVDNRCWLLVHQPKEPKDLAKRLNTLDIL